jgi:MYXO-CTERM domain-containing protein
MRVPALVLVALACAPTSAAPVITEVAWMGSDAAVAGETVANNEWIEIFNPGPGPICDLSDFALTEGSDPERRLPAVALAENAVLVLERQPTSTALEPPAAAPFAMILGNGGEVLKLCPAGLPADPSCDVTHAGGAWPAGSNTAPRRTMERTALAPSAWGAGAAAAAPGAAGSPGQTLLAGVVGDVSACGGGGGEGEGEGEGEAFAYPGLAITEIFFNPAGTSEAGKEWVEIANLSTSAVDLSACTFERSAGGVVNATFPLGTGVLAPGARVVVARSADLGVGICVANVIAVDGFGLTNSTQQLRLAGPGFENVVTYGGTGAAVTSFDGKAMVLGDETRDNQQAGAFVAATCAYGGGAFGSPGVASPAAGACDAPAFTACPPDAGVVVDAGSDVFVDAGPNAEPVVVVSAPSAPIEAVDDGSGPRFDLTWSASDADGDDVAVDVFVAIDAAGQDGLRVARGLPGGDNVTRSVSLADVPAGTWHVFVAARDTRGAVAYAYAAGTVAVGGGGAIDAAFRLVNPDGVDDVDGDGNALVTWEVDLPAGQTGSVALFLDGDDDGQGGAPLIGGLPAVGADGEEVGRVFNLDTSTLPDGVYFVYGVLSHGGPDIVSVADGVLVVSHDDGCACAAPGASGSRPGTSRGLPALLLLAMLLSLVMVARRHSGVRGSVVAGHGEKA